MFESFALTGFNLFTPKPDNNNQLSEYKNPFGDEHNLDYSIIERIFFCVFRDLPFQQVKPINIQEIAHFEIIGMSNKIIYEPNLVELRTISKRFNQTISLMRKTENFFHTILQIQDPLLIHCQQRKEIWKKFLNRPKGKNLEKYNSLVQNFRELQSVPVNSMSNQTEAKFIAIQLLMRSKEGFQNRPQTGDFLLESQFSFIMDEPMLDIDIALKTCPTILDDFCD